MALVSHPHKWDINAPVQASTSWFVSRGRISGTIKRFCQLGRVEPTPVHECASSRPGSLYPWNTMCFLLLISLSTTSLKMTLMSLSNIWTKRWESSGGFSRSLSLLLRNDLLYRQASSLLERGDRHTHTPSHRFPVWHQENQISSVTSREPVALKMFI